jgi:hypothetical protein
MHKSTHTDEIFRITSWEEIEQLEPGASALYDIYLEDNKLNPETTNLWLKKWKTYQGSEINNIYIYITINKQLTILELSCAHGELYYAEIDSMEVPKIRHT